MKQTFKTKYYKSLELIGFVAFLSVIVVQRCIRPNSRDFDESIKHLLGVMPNLLAGIAMCIAFFIYGKPYFIRFQMSPKKGMLVSMIIAIVGLTLWEYFQILAHRKFDNEDVMASTFGGLLSAIAIYINIQYNRKYNRVE